MIRTILIDDEQDSLDVLKIEIEDQFKDIQVLQVFRNSDLAKDFLLTNQVDVVFLDIEMPGKSGLQFLSEFGVIKFELIFVTAYQNYAVKAFEFYAVDYLLKPVDPHRLKQSIDRLRERLNTKSIPDQYEKIARILASLKNIPERKISIPSTQGFELVGPDEILYIEAAGNYSIIHLKEGKKCIATKNLKDFENFLDHYSFVRIHNSVIISLSMIKRYIKGDGGIVVMSNGAELPVSRSNKIKLLSQINRHL